MYGKLVIEQTELAKEILKENKNGTTSTRRKVAGGLTLSANANDPRTYEQYFGLVLRIERVKTHQILAINRGEKLGFLSITFHWDTSKAYDICMNYIKNNHTNLSPDSLKQVTPLVRCVVCLMDV